MSIGKKIALGFGLSLFVLLGVALVSFKGAQQLIQTTEGLVDSREQGRLMRQLHASMVDAETGQRGFMLTGSDSYLEPYNQALKEIDTVLSSLHERLRDEPEQANRLSRIEPLVRDKLAELEETIRLRRDPKTVDDAMELVRSDRGKHFMVQIRQLLGDMEKSEEERWNAFETNARDSAQRSILVLSLGTLLGLLIVGLGSYLITRSITSPLDKLVKGTVELGRGHLEHRIDVVNSDETGELKLGGGEHGPRKGGGCVPER